MWRRVRIRLTAPHYALDAEGIDKNFAIHFPVYDQMFGTHYLPDDAWPCAYGVPEKVPQAYQAQLSYPFVPRSGSEG